VICGWHRVELEDTHWFRDRSNAEIGCGRFRFLPIRHRVVPITFTLSFMLRQIRSSGHVDTVRGRHLLNQPCFLVGAEVEIAFFCGTVLLKRRRRSEIEALAAFRYDVEHFVWYFEESDVLEWLANAQRYGREACGLCRHRCWLFGKWRRL